MRSSWKLLYAIDDPYSLRVVQIHLKFEHFFKILSILVISKKSVQYHCRWNLKQYAIKLKITQCDRWPIFTPRWTKDFEFGHVIANITITLISLKISRYYRSSNSKHCGSNWDFEFQHFSEIIPILAISKKYIWCRCWDNLNQLRSSWKLLNAIDDTYSLRFVQIHFKFEHFFEIISILVISNKSVQYHCRWKLNKLRSSWKLLNAIDDPYLVRVEQNTSNSDILSQISL